MESPTKADLEEKLGVLYQNLSVILEKLQKENQVYQEDSGNAYMYILFVLTFYAFSIVVLMVKYIRREREGSKLEFYYNEFVKRDWYKDKNLYDKTGRRIYYTVDQNNKVIKVARKSSRIICDDPEIDFFQADKIENSEEERKSPLILCVQPNSAISLNPNGKNLGARPKKSSIKNWPLPKQTSFHRQSLDEALELRNVNSLEDLAEDYQVAQRIDRRISIDVDEIALNFVTEKLPFTNIDK